MRVLLYGGATLALASAFSPDAVRSALAASSGALFESTPFLMAGLALARMVPQRGSAVAYFGCGCASGPSARSLPAAAATAIVFGVPIAIARYLAALLVARALRTVRPERCAVATHPLAELADVLPAAILAGVSLQVAAAFDPGRLPPVAGALFGAVLGFVAAPCGLGTVPLAGALRVRAPIAAAAFLCVAGIVDARALRARAHAHAGHDALGYALLAAALAVVGARHGDALVHPVMSIPLLCSACVAAIYAVAHRRERSPGGRVAPALMLAGALLGAAPPQYHATETTLSDLFAGERLTFTGQLTRNNAASAVVRYAITCCRADASPVAVRLDRSPPFVAGTWLRVDGRIESIGGKFCLVTQHIARIAPPTDPFIYR